MCNAKTLLASEAVSFSSLSRFSVKKLIALFPNLPVVSLFL